MKRKRNKTHTTCHVAFEDYSGDLHRATVRIPRKAPVTSASLTRLASAKARHKAALLIEVTCSDSGRIPLPHKRRR